MTTTNEAAPNLSKEDKEKMERFEKHKAKVKKELGEVLSFLTSKVGMKQHKAILLQRSSCEFFRGVNFHVAVLAHADKIMSMIPTLREDATVTQLSSIADSIKLGNAMLNSKNLI